VEESLIHQKGSVEGFLNLESAGKNVALSSLFTVLWKSSAAGGKSGSEKLTLLLYCFSWCVELKLAFTVGV